MEWCKIGIATLNVFNFLKFNEICFVVDGDTCIIELGDPMKKKCDLRAKGTWAGRGEGSLCGYCNWM